jgi:hypothetical protein
MLFLKIQEKVSCNIKISLGSLFTIMKSEVGEMHGDLVRTVQVWYLENKTWVIPPQFNRFQKNQWHSISPNSVQLCKQKG